MIYQHLKGIKKSIWGELQGENYITIVSKIKKNKEMIFMLSITQLFYYFIFTSI